MPVNLKLVVEGSEEQGTGGLEAFVEANPDLLRADTILVCDTGNRRRTPGRDRQPARHGQRRGQREALASEVHSGMFGGAALDALAALIAMLADLRDEHGNTTIPGSTRRHLAGHDYPPEQFRTGRGRARRGRPARRRQGLGHAVGPARGDRAGHRLPAGGRFLGRDRAARGRA